MKNQGMGDKNQGEGNRDADRRYREGVKKTVDKTTPEERADEARDMTPEEREEAARAEAEGERHARH